MCISLIVVTVKTLDGGRMIIVIGFAATILLFGKGMGLLDEERYIGQPKTSIKNGIYKVVQYTEVLKDTQYYQIVLEQGDEAEFYILPKDMINTVYQLPEASGKSGTLEVIEKSGLRKATLYIPLRK